MSKSFVRGQFNKLGFLFRKLFFKLKHAARQTRSNFESLDGAARGGLCGGFFLCDGSSPSPGPGPVRFGLVSVRPRPASCNVLGAVPVPSFGHGQVRSQSRCGPVPLHSRPSHGPVPVWPWSGPGRRRCKSSLGSRTGPRPLKASESRE